MDLIDNLIARTKIERNRINIALEVKEAEKNLWCTFQGMLEDVERELEEKNGG